MSAVGRSGTTALRNSLGKHPDVYYNGKENNFVQDIATAALRNKTIPSRRTAMVVQERDYDLAFTELLHKLLWPDEVSRVNNSILMCAINADTSLADYLFKLFQNAKLLYLVRNGVGVITSRQNYPAFSDIDFPTHCEVWNQSVQMAYWVRDNPKRATLFHYEWLLDESTLKEKLSDAQRFCGLEPSEDVLDHIRAHRYHPTSAGPKGRAWKKASDEERKKAGEDALGRWNTWSEEERKTFEEMCGAGMASLGYEIPWHSEG